MLKAGEDIEAVVLGINQDEQKISLGIRQLDINPWDLAEEKYKVGAKVSGKIRNLTSYGAFMGLEEGLDAMIHVSDISWTRRVNHPSEVLKKGMDVEAQVLEVDRENQRISVGIKQLDDDPWDKIAELYKIGDLVEGKVSKLASFGAFVGLDHDIDGLVHISQVSEERVEKIKDVLNVGEEVTARVIKIDRSDRRIGLSIKAATYTTEQLKEEEAVLDALKPAKIWWHCNTPLTPSATTTRRPRPRPPKQKRKPPQSKSPRLPQKRRLLLSRLLPRLKPRPRARRLLPKPKQKPRATKPSRASKRRFKSFCNRQVFLPGFLLAKRLAKRAALDFQWPRGHNTRRFMGIIEELEWRGLISDCTDREGLAQRLAKGP